MSCASSVDAQELKNNIRTILEFYKGLGFEKLPFIYNYELTAMDDKRNSKLKIQDSNKSSQNQEVGVKTNFAEIKSQTHNSKLITLNPSFNKETALKALREEIGDCQRCKLSKGRTHIVFGEGNTDAKIMFIGEAPGREEDIQARPFVGEAGQLLTRLIERMGFKREDVYIANIVKCRPSMNRDPHDDEMSACFPFLDKQIEIISPAIIVSLGKISAYKIMGVNDPITKFSITKVRGRFFEYKGIPVMPTFHPAYLLRNKKDKWLTWNDMQEVLKKLRLG